MEPNYNPPEPSAASDWMLELPGMARAERPGSALTGSTRKTSCKAASTPPVLDHMNITGDDRDREAQFVVRSIGRVIDGL
jgi:hypothetical protein